MERDRDDALVASRVLKIAEEISDIDFQVWLARYVNACLNFEIKIGEGSARHAPWVIEVGKHCFNAPDTWSRFLLVQNPLDPDPNISLLEPTDRSLRDLCCDETEAVAVERTVFLSDLRRAGYTSAKTMLKD